MSSLTSVDFSELMNSKDFLLLPMEEMAPTVIGSQVARPSLVWTVSELVDIACLIPETQLSHTQSSTWNATLKVVEIERKEKGNASSSDPDGLLHLEPLKLSRYTSQQLLRLDWDMLKEKLFESQESSKTTAGAPYTNLDCLCQRGGKAANHPGCQAFLKQKEAMQPRYKRASPAEKYEMSKELVAFVHNRGGRFLKMGKDGTTWSEIDYESARRKASQALRDQSTNRDKSIHRSKSNF